MANIKSAMKRVKVNKVKAAANKARKSELKTVLKKANSNQAGGSGMCKGSAAQEQRSTQEGTAGKEA